MNTWAYVESLRPALVSALRRASCVDTHEIDDLVQDTLIHAYERMDYMAKSTNPAGLLVRMAINIQINRLRCPKHRAKFSLFDYKEERLTKESDLPEISCEKQLLQEKVRRAIRSMPSKKRVAVCWLFYIEERTLEEIATHLDIPIGTVKSQLFRGREALSRLLYEFND